MKKLRAGIIGATGMVGQHFILLLQNHPYFEISFLAASARSAGKSYEEAAGERWKMNSVMPESVKMMNVYDANDISTAKEKCDFVFCAVDMNKDDTLKLEELYAKSEIPVVSNNSANRWTEDVPMVIPEINPEHLEIIGIQKKRLGTNKGFIAVKPNCSIQSYVPMISPLLKYGVKEVAVSTYQAISGAGKTFNEFPEILDNVIPYIGGEEEKSEKEPLKIWGSVSDEKIIERANPAISAQCIRVPVSDGHMAAVFIKFQDGKKPSAEEIKELWKNHPSSDLPSAPKQFIHYFEEDNRPQTKLDRELENGMAISAGRLREDRVFDYKFIGLSHNTIRGAAGGAVLIAELLFKEGHLF